MGEREAVAAAVAEPAPLARSSGNRFGNGGAGGDGG